MDAYLVHVETPVGHGVIRVEAAGPEVLGTAPPSMVPWAYNYRDGWRVYGVPSNGRLPDLIRESEKRQVRNTEGFDE